MTPLRCVSCGADLIEEARFCHHCGQAAVVLEVIDLGRDGGEWGEHVREPLRLREGRGPPRSLVAAAAVAGVMVLAWLAGSGSRGDNAADADPTATPSATAGAQPAAASLPTPTRPTDGSGSGGSADAGAVEATNEAEWRWTGPPDLQGVRPVGVTKESDGLRLFGWVDTGDRGAGLHVWHSAEIGGTWIPAPDAPVLRSDIEVTNVVATPGGYLATAQQGWLDALWWSTDGIRWDPVPVPSQKVSNPVVGEIAGRIVLAGGTDGVDLRRILPGPVVDLVLAGGSWAFDEAGVVVRGAFGLPVAEYSWADLGVGPPPAGPTRAVAWSRPIGGGVWRAVDGPPLPVGFVFALANYEERLVLTGDSGAVSTANGTDWDVEVLGDLTVLGWRDGSSVRLRQIFDDRDSWQLLWGEDDPVRLDALVVPEPTSPPARKAGGEMG